MAQRQDFEGEIVPTSEEGKRIGQDDPESGQHSLVILITKPRQSIISRADGLFATHRTLDHEFATHGSADGPPPQQAATPE